MTTEKQRENLKLGQKKGARKVRIGALTVAKLMQLLSEGVYTRQQLADESGLAVDTVGQYLVALHKIGMAHITERDLDSRGRRSLAVYKLGPGKDVPAIGRKQTTEMRARWRRNAKGRKEQMILQNALAGVSSAGSRSA